jgi:hypothetical protein
MLYIEHYILTSTINYILTLVPADEFELPRLR